MERRAVLALLSCLLMPAAARAERATADEAQAMVKKAIDFYRKQGRERALQEFAREGGPFLDRELYVTLYEMDGTCLAHINSRLRGMNTRELRDLDGKYYIRDRLEAAQEAPNGWQDYKSYNVVSRKVEAKKVYWERFQDLVFACGAYKRIL